MFTPGVRFLSEGKFNTENCPGVAYPSFLGLGLRMLSFLTYLSAKYGSNFAPLLLKIRLFLPEFKGISFGYLTRTKIFIGQP